MKKLLSVHKFDLAIVLPLVFLLMHSIYWLVWLLVIPFIMAFVCFYLLKWLLPVRFHPAMLFTCRLFLLITYTVICKLYVFDIYRVNSESMGGTLKKGDVLLINKLAYGPAAIKGIADISWIRIFADEPPPDHKFGCAPIQRKSGYSVIHRNDIFVYELFPDFFVVKRCIALPGDIIRLRNDSVFINGQPADFPASSLSQYVLKFKNQGKLRAFVRTVSPEAILSVDVDSGRIVASLPYATFLSLRNDREVQVERLLNKQLDGKIPYFCPDKWTVNTMGPFTIPFKGLTITLDAVNSPVYKETIRHWECRPDLNWQPGLPGSRYSFGENYYFMLGDNKPVSEDSRYLGVIPEKNIVGKVVMTIYSYHDGTFSWKRLFRNING
ncbi:signal peptidase I [Chitinophaga japonensis]|uniref:Signal peptidase I n=1 Tax=Chitinophaga japonensis TaxID=104662 RepID=A0A562T6B6_CHIJA|nr:signal peptidase I [Chitinophaga japonensis]TWI88818.1 signal peptidase I [Chitinophaga japonensis]